MNETVMVRNGVVVGKEIEGVLCFDHRMWDDDGDSPEGYGAVSGRRWVNGMHIPDEARECVFRSLTRPNKTRTRKELGIKIPVVLERNKTSDIIRINRKKARSGLRGQIKIVRKEKRNDCDVFFSCSSKSSSHAKLMEFFRLLWQYSVEQFKPSEDIRKGRFKSLGISNL